LKPEPLVVEVEDEAEASELLLPSKLAATSLDNSAVPQLQALWQLLEGTTTTTNSKPELLVVEVEDAAEDNVPQQPSQLLVT